MMRNRETAGLRKDVPQAIPENGNRNGINMRDLLAHDIGTSGDKATLFDEEGRLLGSVIKNYDVHIFNGNWAEQDAEEWWREIGRAHV